MSPRLTVIVACYRLAGVIDQTLASLAGAIDDDVELLFIDDCSPDDTAERIERSLGRLGRARLHRCEQNIGLSGVRNLGLEMTETEFVTFFDGDDWVTRGWYPYLRDALAHARVDFVRTDHIEATGRTRLLRRIPDGHRQGRVGSPRQAILPVDQRTAIDVPYAWAGAYRTELRDAGLLSFTDLRTTEDRPWIWQLFLGAESFTIPSGAGVHYRMDRPDSLTKISNETQLEFVRSMEQTIQLVRADAQAAEFLPKAVRRYLELTLHHLGRMDRFTPELAARFTAALTDSLHAIDEVPEVLAELPAESRERLTRLLSRPSRTKERS